MALGFLATPDEPLDLPDMHLCGCRGWYPYTFAAWAAAEQHLQDHQCSERHLRRL